MGKFQFLLRCMFRRKLRTTLTMLSLITAFLLFMLLRSIAFVFDAGWEGVDEGRLQTQSKYSMIEMLPLTHIDQIANVAGVGIVTHSSWFGGVFQEGDTNVATFAVDPETYFDVYSEFEVDAEQLEEFRSIRTAALAPEPMIERYGWEIGQKVPVISPIYPTPSGEPWVFDLVGSYSSGNESDGFQAFLFQHEYLRETFDMGVAGWFVITIDDPSRSDEISAEIDKLFANSPDETRTMTESEAAKQFMAQLGDISLMMTGILSSVFFTMVLLTANTMIQGYRERTSELAVMKTLGFTDLGVATYLLLESVLLCAISAVIGIGLGSMIASSAQDFMPPFVPIYFAWQTVLWAGCIALGLGLLVGLVPAISAIRLSIVDALHRH
ncbi:MAG: FtsX-like permease family protein [Gammaproteobacteria bacterium]|nr:FtsX-like permease family protein [Gammaproteobacteria bacterium]